MDANEDPVPLPNAAPIQISPEITIQPPLSRRGHGPGLLIVVDPESMPLVKSDKFLDPPPMQKWAEEGFAVAQIVAPLPSRYELDKVIALDSAMGALKDLSQCDGIDGLGLISYLSDNTSLQAAINGYPIIKAVVAYSEVRMDIRKPTLCHVSNEHGRVPERIIGKDHGFVKGFYYPNEHDCFVLPSHKNYSPASAALAHTRSLSFLKPLLDGPYFDLEAIWNEHTKFEFEERSVAKTMGTMVAEPFVNHIPTMTGGIGRERLTNFYRHHFIFSNPPDTRLELVSRTVGIDRVIDEFVFHCTHTLMIDWLAPGIPPTNRPLSIAFTSIVNIRGDRLYHEHIAWDQASVLVQLGLMPEYLPFPYPLPDGRRPGPGKKFEVRVPAVGAEAAAKLVDEASVESNGMMKFDVREVDE
ncbi:carboxymethylenebutenolidase [Lepidopterella palustris CBS 459.81]|uniref:Carboxymethylenebutenolidase n=1 Tax=Lepidopterella palustris CBS 459.81 TaxID=1314670 RepID=A0A8E2EIR7_9PEZI|nr:carboxymethylenebutenolidase [Lepidopterella palustris CBS 459.81]